MTGLLVRFCKEILLNVPSRTLTEIRGCVPTATGSAPRALASHGCTDSRAPKDNGFSLPYCTVNPPRHLIQRQHEGGTGDSNTSKDLYAYHAGNHWFPALAFTLSNPRSASLRNYLEATPVVACRRIRWNSQINNRSAFRDSLTFSPPTKSVTCVQRPDRWNPHVQR